VELQLGLDKDTWLWGNNKAFIILYLLDREPGGEQRRGTKHASFY